ncbi:MAG: hypothetical protein KGL39_28375 [Patescibacteria group bacterium]|nr:hypothetical protein [Patescibacteria group bacterium]
MSETDYLIEIARTDSARDLHMLRALAESDGDLTAANVTAVKRAVAARFGTLNAAAAKATNRRPRW